MIEDARRKGLGRGLLALLEERPDDRATMDRLRTARTVSVGELAPNPYQPRRHFAETELKELADSVRVNGVLMPILVRRRSDGEQGYEIVAGERRWRAAQLAQLHEVPVVVRDLSDGQALELALIENIQRQDLNALEEAEGYCRLLDEFGHTQEALAEVVGKSRSHVANLLRLLGLPDEVKDMVRAGQLSAGHARAVLAAADPTAVARSVVRGGLSVREAERLSQQAAPTRSRTPASSKDANTRALERCYAVGESPVAVLRTVARHLQRLHLLALRSRTGSGAEEHIRKLRPPVFFKHVPIIRGQLRLWDLARLGQAMELVTQAELECKSTGFPAEAMCSRALMRLATAARMGAR